VIKRAAVGGVFGSVANRGEGSGWGHEPRAGQRARGGVMWPVDRCGPLGGPACRRRSSVHQGCTNGCERACDLTSTLPGTRWLRASLWLCQRLSWGVTTCRSSSWSAARYVAACRGVPVRFAAVEPTEHLVHACGSGMRSVIPRGVRRPERSDPTMVEGVVRSTMRFGIVRSGWL
jgi:hypothetical protein